MEWADMSPEERKEDFLSRLKPSTRHSEETLFLVDAIDWSTADSEGTDVLK